MRTNRPLALAMMVLYLGACTGWQLQPVAPAQYLVEEQPSKIRVTTGDDQTLVLEQPFIRNDSLLGRASGQVRGSPLAAVTRIETSKTNVGMTALLVFGIGAVIAGGVLLAVWAENLAEGS